MKSQGNGNVYKREGKKRDEKCGIGMKVYLEKSGFEKLMDLEFVAARQTSSEIFRKGVRNKTNLN